MAVGSGIRVSSTPIRISPPAMPNRPDRNAVATINSPSAAIISGVIQNLSNGRRGTLSHSLAPLFAGRGWGEGLPPQIPSARRVSLTRPTSLRFAGRPLPASGARRLTSYRDSTRFDCADISALLVPPAQTELSCPGISFPEGEFETAPVFERHQGLRGGRARRQLRRGGRRAQRLGGGGQSAGASVGRAARRGLVRAQGQPAGADIRRARLSERADADLRRALKPDPAGHAPDQRARPDHPRRAALCPALAY